MTRKDYEVLAHTMRELTGRIDGLSRARVIRQLAEDLKRDNPKFDTARFYRACAKLPEED